MNGRWMVPCAALLTATFLAGDSLLAQQAAPVRQSIAEALASRAQDAAVTIAGRATVSSGKLQASGFEIAMEDASGGIRVFTRSPTPAVTEGDSVVATGTIKNYRGSLELVALSVAVIPSPRRTVVPRETPIDPPVLAEHSGRLVRVRGRVAGFGHSEGGQWLRLRASTPASHGTLTVWVPANHGAPVDLSVSRSEDSLVVTGIVTSYQDNADDPVIWQVVPRDGSDVQMVTSATGLPSWLLSAAAGLAALAALVLLLIRIGARRQLRALRETDVRYRQLLALLPDAVIVHEKGTVLFNNAAASELLALPEGEELVGRALADFVHADAVAILDALDAPTGETSVEGRAPRVRARLLRADGSVADVEASSSPCVYHDRRATLLLARDIAAQLRYERDLHALALVDELTGIQNRRAFSLFAEQELARARRHGRTPVVVFADLDGLKQINDEHGHAAGDEAIRLVATALKSILRETDIVARWSGDEFVALMGEGGDAAAQQIATRLDAAIEAHSPAGLPYVVSASVGTSPLDPALPLQDAMERADARLYAEKKRGRRSTVRRTPSGIAVMSQPE